MADSDGLKWLTRTVFSAALSLAASPAQWSIATTTWLPSAT